MQFVSLKVKIFSTIQFSKIRGQTLKPGSWPVMTLTPRVVFGNIITGILEAYSVVLPSITIFYQGIRNHTCKTRHYIKIDFDVK